MQQKNSDVRICVKWHTDSVMTHKFEFFIFLNIWVEQKKIFCNVSCSLSMALSPSCKCRFCHSAWLLRCITVCCFCSSIVVKLHSSCLQSVWFVLKHKAKTFMQWLWLDPASLGSIFLRLSCVFLFLSLFPLAALEQWCLLRPNHHLLQHQSFSCCRLSWLICSWCDHHSWCQHS